MLDTIRRDYPLAMHSVAMSLGSADGLRFCEVLRDSFAKTYAYMGQDLFDENARLFAVQPPPTVRNLGRYGSTLPLFFLQSYPDKPELHALGQLDWDLRSRFDCEYVPSLNADGLTPTAQVDRLVPTGAKPYPRTSTNGDSLSAATAQGCPV